MSRMLWPTELRARMCPSFRAVTSPSAANPRFYPKGPLPLSHGIVCSRPYHVRIMGRYVSGTGISSGGMRILVISDIPFG